MMKRYASHFVLSPNKEWLRFCVLEVDNEAIRLFPLKEELPSVEWLPGVIVLFPRSQLQHSLNHYLKENSIALKRDETIDDRLISLNDYSIYHLYPYDFTLMQPVAETRSIQLL